MVSFDKPWLLPDSSTRRAAQFEEIIRHAARERGWNPDKTVKKVNQLVGENPELRKELDALLVEAFERAMTAELLDYR